MFNAIKQEQVTPPQWEKVKITPIYKNKGSERKLVNQRGIFLSVVISKMFERLIKERISEFTNKISVWQAGATQEEAHKVCICILNQFLRVILAKKSKNHF